MKMQTEPSSLHQQFSSPSFSSYSSDTLAQIAARVIHNLHTEDTLLQSSRENDNSTTQNDTVNNDDSEFEFNLLSTDSVSADDIFHNGQITPTYPLFDQSLLNGAVSVSPVLPETVPRRRRLPLRKLMAVEGEEFDDVAPDTYCVWTPPCKKSSSTGSASESKRWKFRDLLLRSHSDGKKESLLFLSPGGKDSAAVNGGAGEAKDGYRSKRKLGISWVIH